MGAKGFLGQASWDKTLSTGYTISTGYTVNFKVAWHPVPSLVQTSPFYTTAIGMHPGAGFT